MIFFFLFNLYVQAAEVKMALIYKGPGACEEGCAEAARDMAVMAGFETKFVGPTEAQASVFEGASLWIQPGGQSSTASKAMVPELKQNIKNFVAHGGGYVGFCAGGFLATEWIADRGVQGLGLLAGTNALYPEKADAVIFPITSLAGVRQIYWEGGPYFLPPAAGVEVMATYPNSAVASARSMYGSGRVYVTGLHPEAPPMWREYYKINDLDGLDYDLAVDMILWATK